MNKKRITFLILLTLSLSAIPLTLFVVAQPMVLPEYEPVDLQSGLAGKVDMPVFDPDSSPYDYFGSVTNEAGLSTSTPPVGTIVYDWYVGAISGNPDLQLRAVGDFVEVWVQTDLSFPEGDPRNAEPWTWMITDEMVQYLADEFDNAIYASVAGYFGAPLDRDGTGTIFEAIGWPSFTWDWIETTDPYNPQRVILKIINYRDNNYYDPTYPSYVAGFFSSTYTGYYNRNMVHLDCWAWYQRLGPEGTSWLPEHPELVVTRPNLYESILAHEFQHNIHRDYVADPESWMNEACSNFAEPLSGYELDTGQIDWFMATPDNSLTVWEEQGNINVLADYGAAFLFALYLTDHYGIDILGNYVQNGVSGIEGINALLPTGVTFEDVFHDWRIANLIQADHGKYGYQLDELRELYNPHVELNFDEIEPLKVHEIPGKKTPWLNAGDYFGETYTKGTSSVPDGYATGFYDVGPFGTEYLYFPDLTGFRTFKFDGDDTTVYGWTFDETYNEWWSGAENLANALLVTNTYTVQAGDILSVPSWYDIEDLWDFGFVQFSTDGGQTWTSMSNDNTTYDHDPGAHPDVLANLPGITGNTGGEYWTLEFDLDDFITPGTEVIFGFRYVTDWATLHPGWYIVGAYVGATELELTPVYPEADFQVTFVHKGELPSGWEWTIVYDMWSKDDATEYGKSFVHGMPWEEIYVVISPINEKGWVDYNFKLESFRSRNFLK